MSEAIKKLAESLENTKVEQDGAIVVITMNRPKALNALNDQTPVSYTHLDVYKRQVQYRRARSGNRRRHSLFHGL